MEKLRECICADPENCKQPLPGRLCRRVANSGTLLENRRSTPDAEAVRYPNGASLKNDFDWCETHGWPWLETKELIFRMARTLKLSTLSREQGAGVWTCPRCQQTMDSRESADGCRDLDCPAKEPA